MERKNMEQKQMGRRERQGRDEGRREGKRIEAVKEDGRK